MSWETTAWRPADATSVDGAGAILDLVPMLKSAFDEAVSAQLTAAIATTAVEIASAEPGELPEGFAAVATFELLGTARRAVFVAVEPGAATTLAGNAIDPATLGQGLAEALDGALSALIGEGLNLAPAGSDGPPDDVAHTLFRLSFTDGDGNVAAIVLAVDAGVPVEFSTHVVALRALGSSATSPAAASSVNPTAAPAAKAAAASPTNQPASQSAAQPASSGAPVQAAASLPPLPANVRMAQLDELPPALPSSGSANIEMLLGVNLQVTVEIGRTKLAIRDVLALTPGSIVELDKLAGEKVDVLVNGHRIASGEVVVVDDNFGVRVTDVVSRQHRLLSADGAA
jgi:flagellar motor switch protein FliN